MGVLRDEHYDVFISYSHADNDKHWDYIRLFVKCLQMRFRVALNEAYGDWPDWVPMETHQAKVFIDHDGMPSNGDLSDEIRSKIEGSSLFIIFVSENYLKSE